MKRNRNKTKRKTGGPPEHIASAARRLTCRTPRAKVAGEENGADIKESKMSREEIQCGIEAMQLVQQQNPPSSEKWQRASVVLHKLVDMLMGHHVPDACGF